jgi:hypothetical protein
MSGGFFVSKGIVGYCLANFRRIPAFTRIAERPLGRCGRRGGQEQN